jgi:NAD(P)-dependent dehydrogenase (short-subunit alcohol dehydrogenase family)
VTVAGLGAKYEVGTQITRKPSFLIGALCMSRTLLPDAPRNRFMRVKLTAILIILSICHAAPLMAADAPTVLVTGANRGLGYAWAEKYAERGWNVIATARRPVDATALQELAEKSDRVRIEMLDATDPDSVQQLSRRLTGLPIDILINNVGMLGEEDEQRLGTLDPVRFDDYMRVNVLSALLVTEALLPNIRAGKQKKIAGISAVVASFAAYPRIHSGLYYYKASKVALNMSLRNLAMDTRGDGIAVAVLSPGVVNTYGTEVDHDAMSPEMKRSMVDIDTSVAGMMKVMDGLTIEGSGVWYRFSGEVINW